VYPEIRVSYDVVSGVFELLTSKMEDLRIGKSDIDSLFLSNRTARPYILRDRTDCNMDICG